MIYSDPKSYYHAQKYPRWQDTMDEEFNSLQKNATWELVSLPPGQTLEILLIQEEPDLIFKEQVLLSLVIIHCCPRPVI